MEVESLSPAPRLNAFIETRLDLDVIKPVPHIFLIQLPSTSAFARQSRVSLSTVTAAVPSKDEADFQKSNAAVAASIYFCKSPAENEEVHPRAIGWRVIEDSSVLELNALDLLRRDSQPDRTRRTLRYAFPAPIRTGGVALAESVTDQIVYAFVMTKNNDLYTLNLHPSLFMAPSPSVDEVQRSFQVFHPSALSISTFYRLFALSSRALLITMGDGRFSRLSRDESADGTQWVEKTFDDGQWAASFRGLLPWHPKQTVYYEGGNLNMKTVHTAQDSPNHEHIITTGLDHTLKAWALSSGKPTIVRDLLNLPLNEDRAPKRTLDPGGAVSLRLFESRSGGANTFHAVTFSSQSSGLFKFWAVTDPNDEDGIYDCFEGKELRLPESGGGALWTLCDFEVKPCTNPPEIEVWVLVRLNKRFKLFYRRFSNIHGIGEDWNTGWVGTVVRNGHLSNIPDFEQRSKDQQDLSTWWINHIFSTCKISQKVVETALYVYIQTKNGQTKMIKGSLAEQIATAVQLYLTKAGKETFLQSAVKMLDAAEKEWNNFWNILRDIESLRWEPVSLAIDELHSTPWLAFTDGFSVIRDCSGLELLAHNSSDILTDAGDSVPVPSVEEFNQGITVLLEQASLVASAAALRSSFPPALQQSCEQAINDELWMGSLTSPLDRMQALYERCNFDDMISTNQFEELKSSLERVGGFAGLRSSHFQILAPQLPNSPRPEPKVVFTSVGIGAMISGAQDLATLQLRTIQDLLCLLTFIFGEVDTAEGISEELDVGPTFLYLIDELKRAQVTNWLATHLQPCTRFPNQDNSNSVLAECTILENLFAHDIRPQARSDSFGKEELTETVKDLLTWAVGNNEISLNNVLVTILCNLLKRDLKLASAFQRFLPPTAWATYGKGRLYLQCGDFGEAAMCFKQAAFQLSRATPNFQYLDSSAGLLDEYSASLFSNGLCRYYYHILSLFASASAHAHVILFARIALQYAHVNQTEDDLGEIRTHLLSQLFRSALALGDFDTATSALQRITDKASQQVALRDLIERIVESGAVHEFLHLPLSLLQEDVDSLLSDQARREAEGGRASNGNALKSSRISYFRILYAWRLRHGDTRGAAAVLIERLEATKQREGKSRYLRGTDKGSTKGYDRALDEYLVGINALALTGEKSNGHARPTDEGWVFVEGHNGQPRRVVRLQDLRDSYGEEMDRLGMLEMGRFGIVDHDDEEEEDLGAMDLHS